LLCLRSFPPCKKRARSRFIYSPSAPKKRSIGGEEEQIPSNFFPKLVRGGKTLFSGTLPT